MRPALRPVRAALALVATALSVTLATAATAQAVPAESTTTLSITAPVSVAAGAKATITGVLRDQAGKPVKAAAVIVRWRKSGAGEWARSVTVTTSSKGAWSTAIAVQLNTESRAEYAGGPAQAGSTSTVVATAARQRVSITSVSPARPAIGELVTVSGTVSKALQGKTIRLQRRLNGSWSTVATVPATRQGTFSFSRRIADSRALVLRARNDSTTVLTRGVSATRTVSIKVTATLYAGEQLAARRVLTSVNGAYTATMRTDGNLAVTTASGATLWSSTTAGKGLAARLSSTGNLSVGTAKKSSWASDTSGAAARLVLQNDGSLVLFSKARTLWSSTKGTGVPVAPALCWSTSFDCISFTSYKPSTSYWRMYAGHNCTNYVAYRMILKGVKNPPWGYPGGSAWEWSAGAKKAKIKIDKTPAVGAVMQWGRNTNGGGRSGHVVYVEKVDADSVTISEDSWSSHASVRVISKSSRSYADAKFIHVADGAS